MLKRSSIRRSAARLAVITLLFFASVGLAGTAQARGALADALEAKLSLGLSSESDRSNAVELNGAGIPNESSVAIFLTPELSRLEAFSIRRVNFYVNDHRVKRESFQPYDLGGTLRDRSAQRVDSSLFQVGENDVRASVKLRNGDKIQVEAVINRLPTGDTIVDIAAGDPSFSILVEAVGEAGLDGVLSGPGPFTVFAPTDEAFVALLGALGLTKAELFADKELLTDVLTYHVLDRAVFAAGVLGADELIPLQGEPIVVDGDAARLNDSNILLPNLAGSNGVIHVIDAVLVPPSIADPQPTIAEIAASDPQFSILLEAVAEVGLDGILAAEGTEVTAFAPTNDAFVDLLGVLGTTKEALFANKPLLTTVLLYHLVNEELFSGDVLASEELFPMESEPIAVNATEGKVNDSTLVAIDIDAANGVVHVIDTVLVPPAALQILGLE